jgi:hypothetical protein
MIGGEPVELGAVDLANRDARFAAGLQHVP